MERVGQGTQQKARKSARGFTLAETVIACLFFSLLFFAMFATLSASNGIFQMQTLNAEINKGGMQLIRSIVREIAESSPATDQIHLITPIPTDGSGNSIVTFQIPVDWDNDGDVVQNDLTQAVEWGAYRFVKGTQQQSWLGGWVRYRVFGDQLLREVLTSANGAVRATDVIVPQGVLAFRVTLVGNRVSIVLTIRKTDVIGQKGPNARTYQTTFDGKTFLRNGG
jgi:hypothetical protein